MKILIILPWAAKSYVAGLRLHNSGAYDKPKHLFNKIAFNNIGFWYMQLNSLLFCCNRNISFFNNRNALFDRSARLYNFVLGFEDIQHFSLNPFNSEKKTGML